MDVTRKESIIIAPPAADDVDVPITSSIASTTDGVKLVIPRSSSTSMNDGVKLLLKLGDEEEVGAVVVVEGATVGLLLSAELVGV